MGPPPGGKGKIPASPSTDEAPPKAEETPSGKGKAKGKGKGVDDIPVVTVISPEGESPAKGKGKGKVKGAEEAPAVAQETEAAAGGKGKAKGKSKVAEEAPVAANDTSGKGKAKGKAAPETTETKAGEANDSQDSARKSVLDALLQACDSGELGKAADGKQEQASVTAGKGKGKNKGPSETAEVVPKGKGKAKENGSAEAASPPEQSAGKGKGKEPSTSESDQAPGKGKAKGKDAVQLGDGSEASPEQTPGKSKGKGKDTGSSEQAGAASKGKGKETVPSEGNSEAIAKGKGAGKEKASAEIAEGKGKGKGKDNGSPVAKASMATKRFQATVRNAQRMRRGAMAFDNKGTFSCVDAVGIDAVRQVEDEEFEAVMHRMGNRSRAGTISAAKASTDIEGLSTNVVKELPKAPWEERPAWKPPEEVVHTLCRQVESKVEVTSTFVFAAKKEGDGKESAAGPASALTKRFQSAVKSAERMRRGAIAFSRKAHMSALDAVEQIEILAVEEEEMARVMAKWDNRRGRAATVSEEKAQAEAVDSLAADVVGERPAAPWDPRPAWTPPEPVVQSVCRHVVKTETKSAEFTFSNWQTDWQCIEEQASGDPQEEFDDALEQFNDLVEQLKAIAAASSDPEPVRNILRSLVGSASASTDRLMACGAIGD